MAQIPSPAAARASLRHEVEQTLELAESTPSLMHPPWIDGIRKHRHGANGANSVANQFRLNVEELQDPSEAELASFPLKMNLTKLRLMMGQKSEDAGAGSKYEKSYAKVTFEDTALASAHDRTFGDHSAHQPPAVADSSVHRPLRRFGSQFVRGGRSAPPSTALDLDITGARTVFSHDGFPVSAAASSTGHTVRPGSGATQRPASAGSTTKRLSKDKIPMHLRYTQEMSRQLGLVRALVSANKADLLADMDAMMEVGWRPPTALVAAVAAAAGQKTLC